MISKYDDINDDFRICWYISDDFKIWWYKWWFKKMMI